MPTYLFGTVLWIPAQVINFKVVAPQYRVAYVASLVFVEVNILCVVRKFSPESVNSTMTSFLNVPAKQSNISSGNDNDSNQVRTFEAKYNPNEDATKDTENNKGREEANR